MTAPADAVLFDFSGTLFAVEEPRAWLARALGAVGSTLHADAVGPLADRLIAAGRAGGPEPVVLPEHLADLYARRDLTPDLHREAYTALLASVEGLDPRVADALYEGQFAPDSWVPYADAARVLTALRARGVKVAVVSNIAWDLRPTFAAHGLDTAVDAFVLSFEVGVMKPDPAIFRAACAALGVPPERALMVGDSPADGGAVRVGARALLLPASPPGAVHGLDAVLGQVRGAPPRRL